MTLPCMSKSAEHRKPKECVVEKLKSDRANKLVFRDKWAFFEFDAAVTYGFPRMRAAQSDIGQTTLILYGELDTAVRHTPPVGTAYAVASIGGP
jgi:hypothetical protein